jgi:hypothetical protein
MCSLKRSPLIFPGQISIWIFVALDFSFFAKAQINIISLLSIVLFLFPFFDKNINFISFIFQTV